KNIRLNFRECLKKREIINMQKIFSYFSEVKLELSKVTWPTKQEVVRLLGLVLIISAVVSVFVGAIDFSLTKTLEYLLVK
ncbi:MAG: preprotein translocase subunit SecE, partial [Candidatus Woesebacteria bacterium]|nr:preprotein translocase subunit SecE [Candidatus Woesebacteria bacterium]